MSWQVKLENYLYLKGLAHEYLSSKFVSRAETTLHSFRGSANKLATPLPRTNYLRNRLNSLLPQNVRQEECLNKLRASLNDHQKLEARIHEKQVLS